MNIYKLGTIWGKGAPDFYEMIKHEGISISHINDCHPKKNSIILITKGHTVKAITILKEDCHPVTDHPELQDKFQELQIDFDPAVLVARSQWIELKLEDRFLFQTQDGICQIHKPEIHQITKKLIQQYAKEQSMKDLIQLLDYKKQIILQGPPGTGKTRLAKLIAQKVARPQELSESILRKILKSDLEVPTTTGYSAFIIKELSLTHVAIRLQSTGTEYKIPLSEIINAYRTKLWLSGNIQNGYDTYTAAMAKYLHEMDLSAPYTKIIQFHPAYSYEDFVRGIVAQSSAAGDIIEYTTVNKLLGEFAQEANENYQNANKDKTEVAKHRATRQYFEAFVEMVEKHIAETGEPFELTPKIFIYEVEAEAFRYTGSDWNAKSMNRMKFKDLLYLHEMGVTTRKQALTLGHLSGLAVQHFTYYNKVVQAFNSFLTSAGTLPTDDGNETLTNYVLIIDEINRANLPAVLGELIYALEYRGEPVESMYPIDGDRQLTLPPNLFIIGTMNTADRSVAHIDYAIRRRFAFVNVLPTIAPISPVARPLFKRISELFIKNFDEINWQNPQPIRSDDLAPDFKPADIWIGHSYFITPEDDEKAREQLAIKLQYEIKPLLNEYLKDGLLLASAEEKIKALNV